VAPPLFFSQKYIAIAGIKLMSSEPINTIIKSSPVYSIHTFYSSNVSIRNHLKKPFYYCRPRHSEEKGKCEKNHEHFREMVPKGKSMNPLTKKDMRYVSNMVNNYPRKTFNYTSPLQASQIFLNEKVFKLRNCNKIN
jgi:hypothetical protein